MATHTTGAAPSTTTQTYVGSIPPALQAFYDRTLLERSVPADVHGRFGQTRPIRLRSGNQIKFRRYESLTADPATSIVSEGVTPTSQSLTVTDIFANLQQYAGVVTLTDLVTLTNQDPVLTEAIEVLGEQQGTVIDRARRDVLAAGTSVDYSNGSTRVGLNTTLNANTLRMSIRAMSRNNAKFLRKMIPATDGVSTTAVRAAYIGIVHPDTEAQMDGGVTGYLPVSQYSSAMKAEMDEVGSFRNIRFFCSTNAKVFADSGAVIGATGMITTTGANCDVYGTLVIADNAYGIVPLQGQERMTYVKQLGSAGTADPIDQRATAGWKSTTTTKILNETWMRRVEHCNLITLV